MEAATDPFREYLNGHFPPRRDLSNFRGGDVLLPTEMYGRVVEALRNGDYTRAEIPTGLQGTERLVVDNGHWPIDANRVGFHSLTMAIMIEDSAGPDGPAISNEAQEYQAMELANSIAPHINAFLAQVLDRADHVQEFLCGGMEFPLSIDMFSKLRLPKTSPHEPQRSAQLSRYKWVNKHVCEKLECLILPTLQLLLSRWNAFEKNENGLIEAIDFFDYVPRIAANPFAFSLEKSLLISLRKKDEIVLGIQRSDLMVIANRNGSQGNENHAKMLAQNTAPALL